MAWAATTGRVFLKSLGTSWRPLVHIEDIALAYIALLHAPEAMVHNQPFNIGQTAENYRIRDVAEMVRQSVPDTAIEFAADASPDMRNYRVNCDRIARAAAGLPAALDGRRRASRRSTRRSRDTGLSSDDFEGPRYNRIAYLKQLLGEGRVGEDLRWAGRPRRGRVSGEAPGGHGRSTAPRPPAAPAAAASSRQILAFGETPLADRLLTADELDAAGRPGPARPGVLCRAAAWSRSPRRSRPRSCSAATIRTSPRSRARCSAHSRANAEELIERLGLGPDSLVVEIASNDGYLLKNFVARGIPVLGIDPAPAPAAAAIAAGVRTLNAFFGRELARRLRADGQPADLILANNVLAHVADLNGLVEGIAILLAPHGRAVLEMPYVADLIEHGEFDTIYHQHLCYFSVTALDRLFRRHGLFVNDVRRLRDPRRLAAPLRRPRGGRAAGGRATCSRPSAPRGLDRPDAYRASPSACRACARRLRALLAAPQGRGPAARRLRRRRQGHDAARLLRPRPRRASTTWSTATRSSRAATCRAAGCRSWRPSGCSRTGRTTRCCCPGTSPTRSSRSRPSTARAAAASSSRSPSRASCDPSDPPARRIVVRRSDLEHDRSCRDRRTSARPAAAAPSTPFYEVRGVPVHQVKLVREPRRGARLRQGRHPRCASARAAASSGTPRSIRRAMRYEEDYESTQAVSPTFNPFHERLARDLIERFDLHGKEVVEIGCGQGEFITMLAELGDNRGLRLRSGAPRRRAARQGDLRQGLLRRALQPSAPGFRLLQDDARARPRHRRHAAQRAAHDRRPARGGGVLHDPGGHADPGAARVLGHLLRALLVLQPGLARARLPAPPASIRSRSGPTTTTSTC